VKKDKKNIQKKGDKKMSTKEAMKQSQEYVNVPLGELVESSTNPRKTFDKEGLVELAESIRSKGILIVFAQAES
jgi:hypothetical protein